MSYLNPSKFMGLWAVIVIVALVVVSHFLPGMFRKIGWTLAALVAVIAAWNEWQR